MDSPVTPHPDSVLTVYACNDQKITHAPYAYWRFWHVSGASIDFALSPSVNTLKQATKLVHRYYPNAVILFGKPTLNPIEGESTL